MEVLRQSYASATTILKQVPLSAEDISAIVVASIPSMSVGKDRKLEAGAYVISASLLFARCAKHLREWKSVVRGGLGVWTGGAAYTVWTQKQRLFNDPEWRKDNPKKVAKLWRRELSKEEKLELVRLEVDLCHVLHGKATTEAGGSPKKEGGGLSRSARFRETELRDKKLQSRLPLWREMAALLKEDSELHHLDLGWERRWFEYKCSPDQLKSDKGQIAKWHQHFVKERNIWKQFFKVTVNTRNGHGQILTTEEPFKDLCQGLLLASLNKPEEKISPILKAMFAACDAPYNQDYIWERIGTDTVQEQRLKALGTTKEKLSETLRSLFLFTDYDWDHFIWRGTQPDFKTELSNIRVYKKLVDDGAFHAYYGEGWDAKRDEMLRSDNTALVEYVQRLDKEHQSLI